jgi:AraC-like DNA-binding protein
MSFGRVLTFTDPFQYQSAIRAADAEVVPTAKGGFHSELTQINLNELWVQHFNERLPRIYAVKMRPGRQVIGFLMDEHQPAMRHSGMDVSSNHIMICGDESMRQRSEASARYGSMSLTTKDLQTAYVAVIGRDFLSPRTTYLARPNRELMSRFLALHQTAEQITRAASELLEIPEVVRNLEQQLTHMMVRCLAEGDLLQMSSGAFNHDRIVARFEEFLEAHSDQPVYLAEICAAISTSERTLRVACEDHLGMGPIRYLSLRRLHLANRELLYADSSTRTVTQIATNTGFWELGRFSIVYRKLFGESPSETLRRPAPDRPLPRVRPSSLHRMN